VILGATATLLTLKVLLYHDTQ